MAAILVALQDDVAPPELAPGLEHIIAWLGPDPFLKLDLGLIISIPLLLFDELLPGAIVIVDERIL
jgi:hypothetical protein